TKPVPNRPFTQRVPRLDWFDGTSSVMSASRSSVWRRGLRPSLDSPATTLTTRPQPTPQEGQVVSTRRAIRAGASFGERAPVGHVATHWPHEVHTEAASAPSPKTPTLVA